ncbi:hypothetical protein BABINDRAFT_32867 [Babjeviella inositovora NRRL Y-12698]|uniref:Transcription initiation factor IIE subunit beta n=1 Tax=Babjeviella inositovora NRRL Y-12698 TaxID=984486 RepID=A0A1E3QXJ7_9ASCO|nr:uncharacterized protein BABINDRAFT_32867 [Babjeviella inositovora NRRL Y-12698]ODQ81757.1 hypothetical protein BABINDRAFT_32867 [Babjeviella inositovora NRRL Y-12698]
MSDLSSSLAAFKNQLRRNPGVAQKRVAIPTPVLAPVKRALPERPVAPAKKPKSDFTVPDPAANNSSAHLSTNLHLAVEYIKQSGQPVRVDKLQGYLSEVPNIYDKLLPLVKDIDRIKYDEDRDTLQYISYHNIKDADDLLRYLRSQSTFKGISVKELKDGWPGCLDAINELETQGKILVSRTKKENSPRLIWANVGSSLNEVDEEFVAMWNRIRLPEPDLIYQSLIDQGLKPTSMDPNVLKKKQQQPEKKQKKVRRGKITNTHMKGILKDYS